MARLTLKAARRAAGLINTAAKKLDTNRDGEVSGAELRAGRRAKPKDAAIKSVATYFAQNRSLTMRDPELSESERRFAADHLNVGVVKGMTDIGITQLGRIDTYKGNKAAGVKANKADGVVTRGEIANYRRTGGKLQMEARPIAELVARLPK